MNTGFDFRSAFEQVKSRLFSSADVPAEPVHQQEERLFQSVNSRTRFTDSQNPGLIKLLEDNVDVNAGDGRALRDAVRYGKVNEVRILVAAGAKSIADEQGRTPRDLLQERFRESRQGTRAIRGLAYREIEELLDTVDELAAIEADPDSVGAMQALHRAAGFVIPDYEGPELRGLTPLTQLVRLAKAGVDVDATNPEGQTLLHRVAGRETQAKILVLAGAQVLPDRAGKTPVDLFSEKSRPHVRQNSTFNYEAMVERWDRMKTFWGAVEEYRASPEHETEAGLVKALLEGDATRKPSELHKGSKTMHLVRARTFDASMEYSEAVAVYNFYRDAMADKGYRSLSPSRPGVSSPGAVPYTGLA